MLIDEEHTDEDQDEFIDGFRMQEQGDSSDDDEDDDDDDDDVTTRTLHASRRRVARTDKTCLFFRPLTRSLSFSLSFSLPHSLSHCFTLSLSH